MKKSILFLAAIMAAMILTGCEDGKNGDDPVDPDNNGNSNNSNGQNNGGGNGQSAGQNYDVYIVGYEAIGGRNVAKYWKNGVGYTLPEGTHAQSIEIVNNDIYIAGYSGEYIKTGDKRIAKYWKNGQSVNLTDGTGDAFACDIKVYRGDIYVAGMYTITGSPRNLNRKAVYWKNGTAVQVTPANFQNIEEIARDICFDDGEMYLYLDNINGRDATYWRDGERFSCKESTVGDYGVCMDVKNGTVHIAGGSITMLPDRPGASRSAVVYWKNTNITIMTDYTANGYGVNDIEAYNNDVYIAGDDAGNAGYWKNGKFVALAGGSTAGAIKIADGIVFAAGGERKKLNCWENGKLSTFNTDGEVFVASMAVVKK